MSWTLQSSCPWTGQSWTSRPWTLSRPITSTGYMEHCELAVNVPDLHSDEYSTDDEQLANEERRDNKRPERTNSVIKIREKKWRSTRVCKVY